MNHFLERLERIILADRVLRSDLRCERVSKDGREGLVIADRLFADNQYVAEFMPPWNILVSFPLTPKLSDVNDSDLVVIYEYVMDRASPYGLSLPFKKEDRELAVGKSFSCMPSSSILEFDPIVRDLPNTLLESAFLEARESLVAFYRAEYSQILALLRVKRVFPMKI
jgi:hypothetical protein